MKTSSVIASLLGALAVASPALALPIGQAGRAMQARDSWTSFWTTQWTITAAAQATQTAAAATTTSAEPESDAVYSTTMAAAAAASATASISASDTQSVALEAHNALRAEYDAPALVWNETLATAASSWADGCQYKHSGGTLLPTQYGENIAAGVGYGTSDLIKLWSDESSDLNVASPVYSHFTAMVWKDTTSVGCHVATCNDLDAFGAGSGVAHYLVCDYAPVGNVLGEFLSNVAGVTCDSC